MDGESVDPQHLQLEIVPQGAPLQAILFIPTRAAGFAQVGQRVRLRYDAFPYENFGTHEGRIVRISRTMLTDSDITAPVLPSEPAYEAVVSLDKPTIDAYGKEVALKPDMLLQADIVLDRVSLARWLLGPLLNRKM
jgi:membrane fusion protein